MTRRAWLSGSLLFSGVLGFAGQARAAGWDDILRDGRGQEVFFHAWGGDGRTNAFIVWASGRVRDLYGVRLRHVKLHDAAEAVAQIAAEKVAGNIAVSYTHLTLPTIYSV